jgi:hypothetical protein
MTCRTAGCRHWSQAPLGRDDELATMSLRLEAQKKLNAALTSALLAWLRYADKVRGDVPEGFKRPPEKADRLFRVAREMTDDALS